MTNYTSVLTLLLRMRQGALYTCVFIAKLHLLTNMKLPLTTGSCPCCIACCHPSLVTVPVATDASAIESKAAESNDLNDDGDDLANLLQGVGIDGGKKCEVCLGP